jgi:hypothetical protein
MEIVDLHPGAPEHLAPGSTTVVLPEAYYGRNSAARHAAQATLRAAGRHDTSRTIIGVACMARGCAVMASGGGDEPLVSGKTPSQSGERANEEAPPPVMVLASFI